METVLVAKALVLDADNNCLMLRRSSTHPDSALKPDLPGGAIDEGETITQAIAREIQEETGLMVEEHGIHVLYAATDASRGRNVIRFLSVARVEQIKPDITISWEHSESQWVPLAEAYDYMEHPEYKKGIAHILENNLHIED